MAAAADRSQPLRPTDMWRRRAWRTAVGLLCGLAVATAGCEAREGQVVQVFDGDSFVMREPGGTETEVRLFGIDAPERHQPWSRRSRQALRGLVRGRALRLVTVTEDQYGRVVATVYRVDDGMDVNAEMLRQGHAWVYRRYTDDPRLYRLEDEARQAGRGLWSLPDADRVPPWRWRQGNRRRDGSEGGR